MKICIKCKFCYKELYYYHCNHPLSRSEPDMINGTIFYSRCKLMRTDEKKCGKEAKWFEAKPITDIKKKWWYFFS